MLITFIRELIFFDVNTFNETFSVSKSSFDNFDEFEQRKFFFRKEISFFLFNDFFFRKRKIIFLFFIETFRLDILIVTTMLIVKSDSNLDHDVSLNVNN